MKKFLGALLCCLLFSPLHGMKRIFSQTRNTALNLLIKRAFKSHDKNLQTMSKAVHGAKIDLLITDEKDNYNFVRTCKFMHCGICKKPGLEVFWHSVNSYGAHQFCFNEIKKIEKTVFKNLLKTLNPRTASETHIIDAHKKFVYMLELKIQNHTSEKITIAEYYTRFGANALRKLCKAAFNLYKKQSDMDKKLSLEGLEEIE